jgi:hypothetical protein
MRPDALTAAPEPIAAQLGFSMFARCPDEFSHPFTTDCALVYPYAMFSPQLAP